MSKSLKTIEQNVIKFILDKHLIEQNDSVLIALSGGPDSIFLLNFLIQYKQRFNIKLAAFHLNHNLRGKESNGDAEFCKRVSASKNIPFYYSSKNIRLYAKRNKLSLEEAGRKVRYKELLRIASAKGFSKIVTAHNADDNTETVLLNLIKGAGLKGLSGIPVRRDKIIRPLLSLLKTEILSYNNQKKLVYRTDSSNVESNYQRNYLRNEVISLIKNKINPQVDSAILKTSEIVKNISSFLEDYIDNHISESTSFKNGKLLIDLTKKNNIDPRLYGDFFRAAVKKYFNEDIENVNVADLEKLKSKQPGRRIEISNKLIAVKERDSIIIYKSGTKKNVSGSTFLKIGEKKKIGDKSISLTYTNRTKISLTKSGKKEYIDADKIKGRFLIRKWKNGDRFYPLGMKNSKKVSDFLNEQKIESHKKSEQLVITISGNIVWLVGIRIDDRYKISPKTNKYLELRLT
ncbi:MAG: tRNA lysidine(34) synthetase TilS [Ignavibacterium sp.]|nr:MAG: tRNA lysidine(34) synthetase TilS [Ignavibacterium sp.]